MKKNGKDDVIGKVALGATGVVLAAGGIAAAALLSNRKRRTAIIKRIGKAKKAIQNTTQKYQAFTHKIAMSKMKKGRGKGRRKTIPAVLHQIGMSKGKKSKGIKRKG